MSGRRASLLPHLWIAPKRPILNRVNREAANILALSSGKIDKYKYLEVEDRLSSPQSRMIEQYKFTYSPLGKAL